MKDKRYAQVRLLADRLERLSADSHWARRASGLRGSLLHALEEFENGRIRNPAALDKLIQMGFEILTLAARETPDPDQR